MERYELGRKLGQGAMGSVHLARRKSDGELLALKTVAVSSSHDRELAANEISILRSLQHTNIVSFYDSFVHQDEIVLVMQYCAGGDLADLIAQKRSSGDRIPDAHVRSMLCQLASALAHVHANRVVHRDIKSSNVFLMMSPDAPPGVGRSGLDADGPGVLLGDFGVAKTLESTKAMACTQCGTPYYLPPEVCNGASYNTRADMWSLGVLAYELCALRYPFTAETLPALVMRILRGKPTALPKSVSPEMRAACAALLQQRPRDRPSADQLLAMLRPPPPPPPIPPPGQIPVVGTAPADRPVGLASSSSASVTTASASLLMARNPTQRREAIKQRQKQIANAYGNPQPKRKKPLQPSRPASTPGSAITGPAPRGAPPERTRAPPSSAAPTRRPASAQPTARPARPPHPAPPPTEGRSCVPIGRNGDFFACASHASHPHPPPVGAHAQASANRAEVWALASEVGGARAPAAAAAPQARSRPAEAKTGAAHAKSVAAEAKSRAVEVEAGAVEDESVPPAVRFGVPEAKDLLAEYRRRKTAAATGRPTVLGHEIPSAAPAGAAPPPPVSHTRAAAAKPAVAQPGMADLPALRLASIETPPTAARHAWASPRVTPADDRDPDPETDLEPGPNLDAGPNLGAGPDLDAGLDSEAGPDLDMGRDLEPDPDRDPDPDSFAATLPKQASFASAAQPSLARTAEEMWRAAEPNEHWKGAGGRALTLREVAGIEDMEVDGGDAGGEVGGAMEGEGGSEAGAEEGVWGEEGGHAAVEREGEVEEVEEEVEEEGGEEEEGAEGEEEDGEGSGAWEEDSSLVCDDGFMQQLIAQPWAPSEPAVEEGEEGGEEAEEGEGDRPGQAGLLAGGGDGATDSAAESAAVVGEVAEGSGFMEPLEPVSVGQGTERDEAEAHDVGAGGEGGAVAAGAAATRPEIVMVEVRAGSGGEEAAGVETIDAGACDARSTEEQRGGLAGGAVARQATVSTGKQGSADSPALVPVAHRAPPPLPPSAQPPPKPKRPPPPLPPLPSSSAASEQPPAAGGPAAHDASTELPVPAPTEELPTAAQAPTEVSAPQAQAAAAAVASALPPTQGLQTPTEAGAAPLVAPPDDCIGMEDIQVDLGGSFSAPAPAAAADPIAEPACSTAECLVMSLSERAPEVARAAAPAAPAATASLPPEPKSFFARLRAFFGGK